MRSTVLFILTLLSGVSAQRSSPSVRTRQGTLLGRQEFISGRSVYSFLAVQYAEPPTGGGRFRHSRPYLSSWSGTKVVREAGYPCPQPFFTEQSSEDCLHLSIWTPVLPTSRDRLRPVMVYLTGNLFTTDINQKVSPEDLVVSRDIVVVTVSSRLNVFGFLSLENMILPGNSGLLDQYYALYWVNSNIAYFGGDPGQITLVGSGSGGAAAIFHALSPRSSPIINRVMAVSGTPLTPWAVSKNPALNAKRLIERLNCLGQDSQSALKCLQSKSTKQIMSAFEQHISDGNISSIFGPVDDSFLRREDQFMGNPIESLQSGQISPRLSFMIGQNEDDGEQIMYFLQNILERLDNRDLQYFVENTIIPVSLLPYQDLSESQVAQQLVEFQYFPDTSTSRESLLTSLSSFLNDRYFLAPLQATLESLSSARVPLYNFVNSQTIGNLNRTRLGLDGGFGSEILYLFGPTQFSRLTGSPMSVVDREISLRVQDLLVPFIEQGSPPTVFQWPQYSLQDRDYMELNTLSLGRNYKDKAAQFWLNLLPKLGSISTTTIATSTQATPLSGSVDVYSTLTWLLLATVLLLLVLLAALWVAGRRRRTTSNFTLGSGLGGSSCIETRGPRPGSGPRSRWRESVTNLRM